MFHQNPNDEPASVLLERIKANASTSLSIQKRNKPVAKPKTKNKSVTNKQLSIDMLENEDERIKVEA